MALTTWEIKAIKAIKYGSEFRGRNLDSIEWLNGTTPISKVDIQTKASELKADYDALGWKRNRQKEYPDVVECIHALLDGGDTLTNLQAQRTAIKNKYSKD